MDAATLFQVLDRDVTAAVFSEWLHFKDIVHLTIAMTNHSLRETYLNLLCDYRVKLKGTDLSSVYFQPLLSWCCRYRIRLSELTLQEKCWNQLTKSQHLFLLADLESLIIQGCASPPPVAAGNNQHHQHAAGVPVGALGVFPVAPPLLFQPNALPAGFTTQVSQIKDFDRFPMISLLSCPHLKKLHFSRLTGLPIICPFQQVIPKLETFILHQITFSDEEYKKLFEGFQNLKHLTLHEISYFPPSIINLSLKQLKSLSIIECSFPVHIIAQFFVSCVELEEIKIIPKQSIQSSAIEEGESTTNNTNHHQPPPSFISSAFIDQLLTKKATNNGRHSMSGEKSTAQDPLNNTRHFPRYRNERTKREAEEDLKLDHDDDEMESDPLMRFMMFEGEEEEEEMMLMHLLRSDYEQEDENHDHLPYRNMLSHRRATMMPGRRRERMIQTTTNSLSRNSTITTRTNTTSSNTSSHSSSMTLQSSPSIQYTSKLPLPPSTAAAASSPLRLHKSGCSSTSSHSDGKGKYALKSITLHNLPISKDLILATFLSDNNLTQHLHTLDVRYCYQISNDTCHVLSRYASKTLEHLNLSGTNITDYGLTEVLTHCLGLISLDISYCNNITDNSLFVLRHNYHSSLTELNLENCHQITDKGLKYLCKEIYDSLRILNIKSIGTSLISTSPTSYGMFKKNEGNVTSSINGNNNHNNNINQVEISPFEFLPLLRCLYQLTIGFYEVPGFCTMNQFRLIIEKCSQLRVLQIIKLPFTSTTQQQQHSTHQMMMMPFLPPSLNDDEDEAIGLMNPRPSTDRDNDKELIAMLLNHRDRRKRGVRSIPSITIRKPLLPPELCHRLFSSVFYQAFRSQASDSSLRSSRLLFHDLELNYRLESLHLRLVNYQDADILFFMIYFQSLQEIFIDRCSQLTTLGLSFVCKYGLSLKKIVIKDCLNLDFRQFVNIADKFGFKSQQLTQPELEQVHEKVFVRYCMYHM